MNIGGNFAMAVRRHPEKVGFIFNDRFYTYGEFNQKVNSIANSLLEMGLKKGL